MSRTFYCCLVRMHPPDFRRRFGDEMLWIYDEAAVEHSPLALLADAGISVLRQWLLSPTTLTVAGALVGGLIPIFMGLACTGLWSSLWFR